jgi:hypothetical protein
MRPIFYYHHLQAISSTAAASVKFNNYDINRLADVEKTIRELKNQIEDNLAKINSLTSSNSTAVNPRNNDGKVKLSE